MKRLYKWLIPPPKWRLPVALAAGIFVGLALFTFRLSNALSYLSDDPETCVNCHVMYPQYATWFHSSHREVAHCNDCHVPHDNFFNMYYFKAQDGMRHATIFTMRSEPQVIRILEAGRNVVHQNCIRCHSNVLADARMTSYDQQFNHQRNERICWDCHRETPHGAVRSLSATPAAIVPRPESPVPEWLRKRNQNQ